MDILQQAKTKACIATVAECVKDARAALTDSQLDARGTVTINATAFDRLIDAVVLLGLCVETIAGSS